jgi:hypothetical protein
MPLYADGNTLVISYAYPYNLYASADLSGLANPKLSARMDGGALYLEYSYEDIKAVLLPVWPFMWQFEQFKGRDIFKEQIGASYANWAGRIYIDVE